MLLSHSADDISVNFFFQFMTQRSKNGSWYACLKYPSVLDNLVILLEIPTPSDSLSSSTNKTNLKNVSSPSNENIYVGLSPHSNRNMWHKFSKMSSAFIQVSVIQKLRLQIALKIQFQRDKERRYADTALATNLAESGSHSKESGRHLEKRPKMGKLKQLVSSSG